MSLSSLMGILAGLQPLTATACALVDLASVLTPEIMAPILANADVQDGRKSYYYQVFGGKEQGWICVCVCVCTCMHRYTVKPLHRHRLICKYNIKYKVSSSESYHNYFTQF